MQRNFEVFQLEDIRDNPKTELKNFSIYGIPSPVGPDNLGKVFSASNAVPDRVSLLPDFEATPQQAEELLYEAAKQIEPMRFFPIRNEASRLVGETYSLRPREKSSQMHQSLSELVAQKGLFLHAHVAEPFEPYYLSREEVDEHSYIQIGSLALARHFDQGKRKITTVIDLFDQDEKAA